MMVPPLALDIDGTLTTPDHRIDPRVFELLPEWDAPVVFATGKAFPYPVALAHFLGRKELVIAENGGVVHDGVKTTITGAPDACRAVIEMFRERGGDVGWPGAEHGEDTVNRWRESEFAVSRDADETLLRSAAADSGGAVEVVDTGYAYHVKSTGVNKGIGLERLAASMDLDPEAFVAIGDSVNDVATFERAGTSYAVANADPDARAAADYVLQDGFMNGTAAVLTALSNGTDPADGTITR